MSELRLSGAEAFIPDHCRVSIQTESSSFKQVSGGKYEEQKAVAAPLESQWYKKTGIYVVSDAWSSKSDYGFGLGHPRSYYKTTGWNARGEENLGDEFFC